ncbi:plastid transcriptionally active 16 protein [Nymphaea thermarum]|nr:plastid transcriptionally active 16 protein [Nymphaea thermarum]
MAHSLGSNSFLLNPSHRSSLPSKNHRRSSFISAAAPKRGISFPPFRLGKQGDGEPGEGSKQEASEKGRKNPFNFGNVNVPDVQALIPISQASALTRRKDSQTVFVAGATGQAGVRITQTLLRQGYKVRAGVQDLGFAQELARIAANYKIISNEELKRLNAVESAFDNPESIAKAIGNATKAVVTVGPGENGPSTAVTALDALKVVQGAELAGVQHVVLIYEVAATPVSTYNVLDGLSSFFSNIFSFNQELSLPELLAKVAETEIGYTLIKANLADDYSPESSYSVVIRPEGSAAQDDYKVSKSQVATLVADVFSNIAIAENKVVEVGTSPSAPARSTDELFSTIPEDGRRKAYAEAVARAKAEEEALEASRKAQEAAEAARKLEEEVKKLSKQEAVAATLAEEAQEKAQAVGSNIDKLLSRAKSAGQDFSWEKLSSQFSDSIKLKPNEVPKVQLATIRGQAKAQTLPPKKAIVKPPKQAKQPQPPQRKLKSNGQKSEVRNVFGGLFKQETIYIDDD